MSGTESTRRQTASLQRLTELAQRSAVFDCETLSDSPQRLRLIFTGRGWESDSPNGGSARYRYRHEVELELPTEFPVEPPRVRWLTPFFHPNVAPTGQAELTALGIEWRETLTLESVCERLWDVIRGAYLERSRLVNEDAWCWYEQLERAGLPWDDRTLETGATSRARNVIRYQRRAPRAEIRELTPSTATPPGPSCSAQPTPGSGRNDTANLAGDPQVNESGQADIVYLEAPGAEDAESLHQRAGASPSELEAADIIFLEPRRQDS